MRNIRRTAAGAGAVVAAALLAPSMASAKTIEIYAGPPAPLKGVPKSADANAFFPRKVKIASGDRIRFQFRGFHTVYFPKGTSRPPLAIPDPSGAKVSGINDAAGNPFWFNGQDQIIFNPEAALKVGTAAVTGKTAVGSGLPEGDPPAPFTVSFKKTGSFAYFCTIHPGMKGKVTVAKRTRERASKLSVRTAKQVAKAVKVFKKRADFTLSEPNVIQAGNDTREQVLLQFFPETLSVKAGTTVTLRMSPKSSEIHTFSFGPADYLKTINNTFITPVGGQSGPPTLVLNPIAGYPSDQPGAPWAYTGSNHGNGYFNSGVLDPDAATPQPQEVRATFTTPGTFHYICLVHGPEMDGDVVVTQ